MKKNYIIYRLLLLAICISSCEEQGIEVPKPAPPTPQKEINLNIEDPLYPKQWYLKNTGQNGGTKGIDINIEPAWKAGYSGKGVTIAMLDEHLNLNKDEAHEDLKDNLDLDKSYNWDDIVEEPHGTNVAGIMVAKDNKLGIRGVAFKSKLYAYGMNLEDWEKNSYMKMSLTKNIEEIAVFNNSWGLNHFDEPTFKDAWEKGLRDGWNGKGTVYVFSIGNDPEVNMSAESSVNFYGLVNVNSMDNKGTHKEKTVFPGSDFTSGYSIAPNIWVTAPGHNMVTTDMYNDYYLDRKGKKYYENFGATSSAAPVVSGVVALIREANTLLTWRDVKLILAETTTKNDPTHSNWQKVSNTKSGNAIYFNHHYGFGLVNAFKAIQLAKKWTLLPAMKTKESNKATPNLSITKTLKSDEINIKDGGINFIESVNVILNLGKKKTSEKSTDDFQLELHHNGIKSELYRDDQNFYFDAKNNIGVKNGMDKTQISLNMLTNAHFGQSTRGIWKLKVKGNKVFTEVKDWKLVIRGH